MQQLVFSPVKVPFSIECTMEARFIVSVVKLNFGHNFPVFGHTQLRGLWSPSKGENLQSFSLKLKPPPGTTAVL